MITDNEKEINVVNLITGSLKKGMTFADHVSDEACRNFSQ